MPTSIVSDSSENAWNPLNKQKLNNGYIHLPTKDILPPTTPTVMMDDESSDAALLDQDLQQQSNDALLEQKSSVVGVSPITNTANITNKSSVIVNLGPNSTQTISTLQRNANNNYINNNSISAPNNNNSSNNKNSDNISIIKNNRKYKFNLFKFSTSSNSNINSSNINKIIRKRLLILSVSFLILGFAIGALAIYFSSTQCNQLDNGEYTHVEISAAECKSHDFYIS